MNESDRYTGWAVLAVRFDGDNLSDLVKYLPGAKAEIVYAPAAGPMGSTRKCASVWTPNHSAVVPVGHWLVVWPNAQFDCLSDKDFTRGYTTLTDSTEDCFRHD